jgi:hypothetical protein
VAAAFLGVHGPVACRLVVCLSFGIASWLVVICIACDAVRIIKL